VVTSFMLTLPSRSMSSVEKALAVVPGDSVYALPAKPRWNPVRAIEHRAGAAHQNVIVNARCRAESEPGVGVRVIIPVSSAVRVTEPVMPGTFRLCRDVKSRPPVFAMITFVASRAALTSCGSSEHEPDLPRRTKQAGIVLG